MKPKSLCRLLGVVALARAALTLAAQSPVIPPSIDRVWPVGMKRDSTAVVTLEGRNLSGIQEVIFGIQGLKARVLSTIDLAQQSSRDRLAAPVPEGRKQEVKLEITIPANVE